MASYPRQIPAGGEGKISIKVNTSGYGGRTLKKSIEVFTNDPANSHITLGMMGNVARFASLKPTFARLVGEVGTDIKKSITITRKRIIRLKSSTCVHATEKTLRLTSKSSARPMAMAIF